MVKPLVQELIQQTGAYIAGELTGSTLTDGKFLGLALFDAGSVAPKSLEGIL